MEINQGKKIEKTFKFSLLICSYILPFKYLDKDIYTLNIDDINLDILCIDLEDVDTFKNKLYSCFIILKKEFKFSDEVNKYLDMYYSKIVKTILFFGLNNKLEFLVGRDDTIIV